MVPFLGLQATFLHLHWKRTWLSATAAESGEWRPQGHPSPGIFKDGKGWLLGCGEPQEDSGVFRQGLESEVLLASGALRSQR